MHESMLAGPSRWRRGVTYALSLFFLVLAAWLFAAERDVLSSLAWLLIAINMVVRPWELRRALRNGFALGELAAFEMLARDLGNRNEVSQWIKHRVADRAKAYGG